MLKHCPASCDSLRLAGKANKKECADLHEHCPQWALLGECTENADVRQYCAKTCKVCEVTCEDGHANCKFWADSGECQVRTSQSHAVILRATTTRRVSSRSIC